MIYAPHLQIHLLPILWKWIYALKRLISLPAGMILGFVKRALEKHCRGKGFCFWFQCAHLAAADKASLGPTSATRMASPTAFCSMYSYSNRKAGSFVVECLWWNISPWTAFPGTREGRYPANSTGATHSYLPWPCPFPTRSRPKGEENPFYFIPGNSKYSLCQLFLYSLELPLFLTDKSLIAPIPLLSIILYINLSLLNYCVVSIS